MGTQLPSPKRGRATPIFGPSLLWPNGWMHQDATWYGGRPQPRGLWVRWRLSPLPKGRRRLGAEYPNFRPMAIVAERLDGSRWHLAYGGRPWSSPHCARWGHSSPPQNRGQSPPNFPPMFIVAKRLDACINCHLVRTTEVGLGLRDIVQCGPSYPQKKGTPTPPNIWPMSIVAKWLNR